MDMPYSSVSHVSTSFCSSANVAPSADFDDCAYIVVSTEWLAIIGDLVFWYSITPLIMKMPLEK
jgi:hypothetical protein